MQNQVDVGADLNVLSAKRMVPSLKELAQKDSEVKDMLLLISKYDLRAKAIKLINKQIAKQEMKKTVQPVFSR